MTGQRKIWKNRRCPTLTRKEREATERQTEQEEERAVQEYGRVCGAQYSGVERESGARRVGGGGGFSRRVLQRQVEERTS